MGKSPKPLRFLVHSSLYNAEPELWEKLAAQGHVADPMVESCMTLELHEYDLILGPKCWRLFDCDGLDLAIQSARRVKYVPGEKKEKKPRKPRKKKEVEE